jgi:small-conductance mechanosensitive channel
MKKNEYELIGTYQSEKKWTLYIFFGIIVFVLLFFPFFAITWRYKVGKSLSLIFDTIGMLCLMIGAFLIFLSVMGIFTGSYDWTKKLIVGIILLYIGCWLTGTVLEFMGVEIGRSSSSDGGYH